MDTTLELTPYETERGKPVPSRNHASVQTNLIFAFAPYRNELRILSEIGLELANWESVPDIAVYPKMEIDFLHDEISMKEPPLTVIEILSPTQSLQELVSKAEKYFEHGVKSCWLALLSLRNVYVFSSPTEYTVFTHKDVLNDPVLSVEMPLGEVFS